MGFGLSFVQILLIFLVQIFTTIDGMGPQIGIISTVTLGAIIGGICGDANTGLAIGAKLALMSLGVVGLGGASVPNYALTCVITCIIVCKTGQDFAIGLSVGLPVGTLAMYLDVAVKTIGSEIAAQQQRLIAEGKFEKGVNHGLWIFALNIVRGALPIALILIAGQAVTEALVAVIPTWLYNGMTLAGNILPVTGMATLLNYLPVKKHWPYLLIGYICYGYLGLSTLPTALIGLALAAIYFMRVMNNVGQTAQVAGGMEDE